MSESSYLVLSACFDPSSKGQRVLKQGDSVCLDEADAERLVTFGRLQCVDADSDEGSSDGSDEEKTKKAAKPPKGGGKAGGKPKPGEKGGDEPVVVAASDSPKGEDVVGGSEAGVSDCSDEG